MEGYGDFCPLSRAAEIYATRWTPLIIRNLQFGCTTFTEIRDGLPGISRTVLTQRLRMLEHHGLVDRATTRRLPPHRGGRGARGGHRRARPLGRALPRDARPRTTTPASCCGTSASTSRPRSCPRSRLVFRFDVRDDKRYWMLLQRPAAGDLLQAARLRRGSGARHDLGVADEVVHRQALAGRRACTPA